MKRFNYQECIRRFCLCFFLAVSALPSQADCEIGACFGVGAELASIDSNDGPVLNLLTQLLLKSDVAINVSNWQGVAQTDVNLLGLLNAVQLQSSVADTEAALTANVSLLNILAATITALQNEGDAAGVSEVQSLQASLVSIPDMNNTIQLGSLITLADTEDALLDVDLNVFHLLMGSLQVFNSDNTLDTPSPLTVNTAPLLTLMGLDSLASSVQLSLRVTEPPSYRCGSAGVSVTSATTRVKLDTSLLDGFDVSDNSLGSLIEVSLAQISVYLELAPAQASLTAVTPASASSGTVNVNATHGIARVFIGSFDDSEFFDPSYAPPVNASVYDDMAYAEIGELSLLGSQGALSVRSYAEGTQTTSGLVFSSFPSTQTADSSVGTIGTLLSELITNLEIDVDGSGLLTALGILGVTLNDVINAISPALEAMLSGQILSPLLTDAVDALLSALGVSIGKVEVFVGGFAGACTVSGRIYHDNTPANSAYDAEESWSDGPALWVHAVSGGSLIGSTKVTAGDGTYTLVGLPLGSYNIVISTLAGATTATIPNQWQAIEPNDGSTALSLLTTVVAAVNFGLRESTLRVNGIVFLDTGVGGGDANDGTQNGTEVRYQGAVLRLLDASDETELAQVETDADGNFALETASSWLNQNLYLVFARPTEMILTGINAGTTGGTYESAGKRLSFTPSSATQSGIQIAIVPPSKLSANTEVVTGGGKTVIIPHRFEAATAGSLTISAAPRSAPSDWVSSLFHDANCDGSIAANESAVLGAVSLAADASYCVLLKVAVAGSANEGAQARWDVLVSYVLNGSVTEALDNHDLITISQRYGGALELIKSVDKSAALPGETLVYTITYSNNGAEAISSLVIYDRTPPFTLYQSSDCASNLGSGLSACTETAPSIGAAGALQWDLAGELMPGGSGNVGFTVEIEGI